MLIVYDKIMGFFYLQYYENGDLIFVVKFEVKKV